VGSLRVRLKTDQIDEVISQPPTQHRLCIAGLRLYPVAITRNRAITRLDDRSWFVPGPGRAEGVIW